MGGLSRNRHEAIGIKQAIRFEWMQKAANLRLAGIDAKTIRQELHEFLADRKGNGSEGERSDQTRTFVVNNLMKIWVSPDPELIPFRDASLAFLQENPAMALLMFESALLATPEAKGALGLLLNNPTFFPFQLPAMTGDFVSQRSDRIDVVRYGLDDELLRLKE
jgi:hypothetical protein